MELSAIERPLRSTAAAEILGYADKYVGGEGMASAPRQLPADLAAPVVAALHDAARAVLALADVRGVARIDFLSDGERPLRERGQHRPGVPGPLPVGGPAPSRSSTSSTRLIGEALARPAAHHSAAGADGTVLRSAGGIASKLA